MQQLSKAQIHFYFVQGKHFTCMSCYLMDAQILISYTSSCFLLFCTSRICPNGATMQYPDRIIPSITLVENFFLPTCQQADEYLKDSDGLDCDFVQSLAGYCGCEGVEKRNSCSFCPDKQESQRLDLKTSSFFTCLDLVDYVDFLSPLDCNRTSELSEKLDLQELQEICQCTPVVALPPIDPPTNSPIDEAVPSSTSALTHISALVSLLFLLVAVS